MTEEDQDTLCQTCFQQQLKDKQNKLATLISENAHFKELVHNADKQFSESDLAKLQRQQTILKEELDMLSQQQEQLNKELAMIKQEMLVIEEQEAKYFRSFSRFQHKLFNFQVKSDKLEKEEAHIKLELQRLQSFNLLNEVFRIEIKQNAGFINGLEIGKPKPDDELNWDNINAALGQLLLLLNFFFMSYDYKMTYINEIRFRTSNSKLVLKGKEVINLYGPLQKADDQKWMGVGLESLLKEFDLLVKKLNEKKELKSALQYPIKHEQGKIGDQFVSLYCNFNDRRKYDMWTTAMKYFLIDIKQLILEDAIRSQSL